MAHVASSLSTLVPSFGSLLNPKASSGGRQPSRQVPPTGRAVQPRAKYFCGVCSDNTTKLRVKVTPSGRQLLSVAEAETTTGDAQVDNNPFDIRKAMAAYSAFAALADQGIDGPSSWTDLGRAARAAAAACADIAGSTATWHQAVTLQESPQWLSLAEGIQASSKVSTQEQLASVGVPDQVLRVLATAPTGQGVKPANTAWAAAAALSWGAMARDLNATAEMLEGAATQGLTSLDALEEKQAKEEVGKLTLLERKSLAVDGHMVEALLLTLQNKMVYQVTNLKTGQYHGSGGDKEAN